VRHPPGRYDPRIAMQDSAIRKRSVMIAGHATSVSLEPEFWDELRALATVRGLSLNALIAEIDAGRGARNLSSALRVHALLYARRHGSRG
jgi:predicted DNA-binding ribbon-helix-helix protein